MRDSNPFQALGLAESFDLDPKTIERAYLAQIASAHPDLGSSGSLDDDLSDAAAALNRARQTLLNPETRAAALLHLHGQTEEDRSLPDGFLMDIMEIRMALEEAVSAGDTDRIRQWLGWAEDQRREWVARIADHFRDHARGGDPQLLSEVRLCLNAWRYIERMIEQGGAGGR